MRILAFSILALVSFAVGFVIGLSEDDYDAEVHWSPL